MVLRQKVAPYVGVALGESVLQQPQGDAVVPEPVGIDVEFVAADGAAGPLDVDDAEAATLLVVADFPAASAEEVERKGTIPL